MEANRRPQSTSLSYDKVPFVDDPDISQVILPDGTVVKNPYFGNKASAGWWKKTFNPGKVAQEQQALDDQAMAWYNEMQLQMYAEKYQSPEQEANRLQNAGFNPDLLGLSGSSSPFGTSATSGMSTPVTDTADFGFDQVFGILDTVVGIVTKGIDIGQSIRLKQGEIDIMNANVYNTMQKAARNDLIQSLDVYEMSKKFLSGNELTDDALSSRILGHVPSRKEARLRGMTRRGHRIYSEAVINTTKADARKEIFKAAKEYHEARKSTFDFLSDPNFRETDNDYFLALELFNKAYYSAIAKTRTNDKKKADNEGLYLDTIDPVAKAEAENSEFKKINSESNSNAMAFEFFNELTGMLEDSGLSKPWQIAIRSVLALGQMYIYSKSK